MRQAVVVNIFPLKLPIILTFFFSMRRTYFSQNIAGIKQLDRPSNLACSDDMYVAIYDQLDALLLP